LQIRDLDRVRWSETHSLDALKPTFGPTEAVNLANTTKPSGGATGLQSGRIKNPTDDSITSFSAATTLLLGRTTGLRSKGGKNALFRKNFWARFLNSSIRQNADSKR